MLAACSLTWSVATSDALAMGRLPQPAPVVVTKCPPLKSYPAGTLSKSAKELRALLEKDADAATPGIVRDYRVLRDQCRAYQK